MRNSLWCAVALAAVFAIAGCDAGKGEQRYTVGGTVSDLAGSGLTLQLNGAHGIVIEENGPFYFGVNLPVDTDYAVTIQQQPSDPNQLCSVANGSGALKQQVTNVTVFCSALTYSVGGSISGLEGEVVLRLNGGAPLTVAGDGGFTFETPVVEGGSYQVTVSIHPAGQSCAVIAGQGQATGDVTSVIVTCANLLHLIGGQVAGLTKPIVVRNNGTEDLTLSTVGPFAFATKVPDGEPYEVEIVEQALGQGCYLSASAGIATSNVDFINIFCEEDFDPPAAVELVEPAETSVATQGSTLNVGGFCEEDALVVVSGDDDQAVDCLDGEFELSIHATFDGDYFFLINQTDVAGNTSPSVELNWRRDNQPPGGVTGLATFVGASVGEASVLLEWIDPPDGDLAGIVIRRGVDGFTPLNIEEGDFVGEFAPGIETALDGGLELGRNYAYSAFAVDAATNYANPDVAFAVPETLYTLSLGKVVSDDLQASDGFGGRAALDGDYLVISARFEDGGDGDPLADAGAAYVFRWTGAGWDGGTKLVASDGDPGDNFGESVAISGDYIIVGAANEDGGGGNPNPNAGAAYIFHRTGENTWDSGTKIAAITPLGGTLFGHGVAIDGDYAVASAIFENGNAGAAYVFHRTGENEWDGGVKIDSGEPQGGDLFGISVAVRGDYVAVGAYNEDGGPADPLPDSGAVYVFLRNGTNAWDAPVKLVAPDADLADFFGFPVRMHGDYLAVGAPFEDGGSFDEGAAYVFFRVGANQWDDGTKIVSPDPGLQDRFGIALDIHDAYLMVGATKEDGGDGDPLTDAGAAYIFKRIDENDWDGGEKVVSFDLEDGDEYGADIALGAGRAVIGAEFEDGGDGDPLSDAGAAYTFE